MDENKRPIGGKVVEDWVLVESLGLFQQLGVLPSTTDFVADFVRAAAPAPVWRTKSAKL